MEEVAVTQTRKLIWLPDPSAVGHDQVVFVFFFNVVLTVWQELHVVPHLVGGANSRCLLEHWNFIQVYVSPEMLQKTNKIKVRNLYYLE